MLAHAVLIGGVAAPHAMRENKGGLMRDQTRGRSRKLGGNPSQNRFRALKVPSGRKHHGIVTKTQTNDGWDGRRGYGGRSGECGARRRSPLGHPGMTHLKNNEAPANDRGCVADASHVS